MTDAQPVESPAVPPPAKRQPEPVIDIVRLSHSFKSLRALNKVSFRVLQGQLHGFVGPNGAGKTTTLKIVCTLLAPQSGNVRVFGHDVVDQRKKVRSRMGFMPDEFSTYRQMTVYEYLDFFGAAYGLGLSDRNRILKDVLSLTDMDGRKDDYIDGLSRGMQQRVSLARVLVNDPDLLLLDEPASGLDPRARIELMEILRELRMMGKTIFISSHILSELADLCDSVTIIDRGQIRYSGSMRGLLSQDKEHPTFRVTPANEDPDIEEIVGAFTGVLGVEQIDAQDEYRVTVDPQQLDADGLLQALLDAGISIDSFGKERRHLNQAFLDLTQRGIPS